MDRWIERVRSGDFSAMPADFSWKQSEQFALLINGYDAAKSLGLGPLDDFVYRKRRDAAETGEWRGSAAELWCILFFERRISRFARATLDRDPLLDKLCGSLRFALQIIPDDQKAVLLKLIADESARQKGRAPTTDRDQSL